jgi:DNA-binding NtrC family response regulator
VHGIVSQSGGHIEVYSEPGLGTSFKLYFPAAETAETRPEPGAAGPVEGLEGTETVLLCEDDDGLRRYLELILTERGYTVVPFARPSDAIQHAHAAIHSFDLLVTDVVMPGLSGPELARRLREERPELRVVFLSGYSKESLTRRDLPPDSSFLEKPFQAEALLRSIRNLIVSHH